MDQVSKPGLGQALVNALRRATGLGGQSDPSAARGAVTVQQMPALRDLQVKLSTGEISPEEYQAYLNHMGQGQSQ